jgi:hypothetical protein
MRIFMNIIKFFVIFALLVLFMGCPVRSLSPLFIETDLVFNTALLGTWSNMSEDEVLTFQRLGEKRYHMILYENEGDSSTYRIQLGKLGEFWFIDSYSKQGGDDYHMVPAYLIWRLLLNEDTLRLAALEGDWLNEMIENNRLDIPYGRSDGDIILTASTAELQELVLLYAEDENAFPDWDTYVRVK